MSTHSSSGPKWMALAAVIGIIVGAAVAQYQHQHAVSYEGTAQAHAQLEQRLERVEMLWNEIERKRGTISVAEAHEIADSYSEAVMRYNDGVTSYNGTIVAYGHDRATDKGPALPKMERWPERVADVYKMLEKRKERGN